LISVLDMLSQTSEYALRSAAFLAREEGTPRTISEVAAATQAPRGYLAKVLQQLARAGVVRSQRGLGGGFVLGRPAMQISVLEVLSAVDPIRRIVRCPLGLPEHSKALCVLHRKLDDAYATIESSFRDTMVGDLLVAPLSRAAPPPWPPPVGQRKAGKRTASPKRAVTRASRRTPWK